MTAVAVVLAGGRGTRSADPSRAKLAQEVDGVPLMQWHIGLLEHSEIRKVVVVAGHAGDQVQALCDSIDHPDLDIEVLHEAEQRGTVPALLDAAGHAAGAQEFLVILGDILMSLPVQDFLDAWRASGRAVGAVVHPSTHPEDSDAVFPSFDGGVIVVPKGQPRESVPNMSSAGLFAITRRGLDRFGGLRDFGSQVLGAAAAVDDLFAFVSSHYLKDTGTPERLEAARSDARRGAVRRRGSLEPRPALILDRDGVINPALPEVYEPQALTLLPGVGERVREANLLGVPVMVVTNQPGIAKGFMTQAGHESIRARMDHLLAAHGAFVDDYAYCPHHPEAGHPGEVAALKIACDCRKPGAALVERLAAHHRLDLAASVMVGDTSRDAGMAQKAGMRFIHVGDPCAIAGQHECDTMSANAIRRGIEVAAC